MARFKPIGMGVVAALLALELSGVAPPTGRPARQSRLQDRSASRAADCSLFFAGGIIPIPSATSIVAADFTNDGKLDLAVGSSGVNVFAGDGAGNFQLAGTTAPGFVAAITAADFNGDGNQDLILGGTGLLILLGDGSGNFSDGAPMTPPIFGNPKFLVAGDFNGDHHMDVAALTDSGTNEAVIVYLGDGAGGFTQGPAVPAGFSATDFLAGDFNGDGRLDLAVANGTGAIVFFGDGSGLFPNSSQLSALGGTSITSADFNGDGRADLAIATGSGNRIVLFLANGAAGFVSSTISTKTIASTIASADYDADGNADIAVFSDGDLTILKGDGRGHFSELPIRWVVQRFGPRPVAQGDFNGDGVPDLVPLIVSGASVLLGDRQGGFVGAPIYTSASAPFEVVAADFNGDGRPDVVSTNPSSTDVSILLGDGQGHLGPPAHFPAGPQPWGLAAADFDRDGNMDLVVSNTAGGRVSVLLGDGTGGFAAPISYFVAPVIGGVAVGDFNRDGNPDVAVAAGPNAVFIMLGDGHGILGSPRPFTVGGDPVSVAVSDFNGDGKLDVVTANANFAGPLYSVLLGNGDGTFQPSLDSPSVGGSSSLRIGDLDGDGIPDLVLAESAGHIRVVLGDGNGHFGPPQTFFLTNIPDGLQIFDFDGDGHLDVGVVDSANQTFSILRGDGTGNLTVSQTIGAGYQPNKSALVDLDGDGRPDVVVSAGGSGGFTVLLNRALYVLPELLPVAARGHSYSVALTSIGGSLPLLYSLAGSLPPGLAFDSLTSTISGTPTETGRFALEISVSDSRGCVSARAVTLDVRLPVDIAVHASPASPFAWQPVTLTAIVTPVGTGTPTGTVTFTIDGVDQPPVPIVNGVATLVIGPLPAGAHSITARYSGDTTFAGGTSTSVSAQSLEPAIPTIGGVGILLLAAGLAIVGALRLR